MSTLILSRPSTDEAAPFYHGYMAEALGEDVGALLPDQLGELDALFATLSEGQAGYRYAPGKWSIKEVLGHVIDAERIFSYRLLRISRGDATPLPSFDENQYVVAGRFDRRALSDLLAEMRAVRTATLLLANNVADDSWPNRGEMSGYGVSARALMYIILGHAAHHMNVLRSRYGIEAAPA